jgi:hypothetical protein
VMLETLEKQPGTALAVFPPPISAGSISVLWFHVSPPPPCKNASGSLYIGVLGQDGESEFKTDDNGGTMTKRDMVARPGLGPNAT